MSREPRRRFGYVYARRSSSGRRIWSAQWHDPGQDGKRVTLSFPTKREAKDHLDAVERRLARRERATTLDEAEAVVDTAAAPRLVAYATHVIETRLSTTLARGTLGVYRAARRALSAYFGDAVRLDQITVSAFLDYRGWRAGTRLSTHGSQVTVSPRTVNADQQFLSRILNEAVLDGHLLANPLAGLQKLRVPEKPRRYLTKAEVRRLVAAAPEHFRPLVVAAIYTGARKSELTALSWGDIDFERGKVQLVRSKVGSCDSLDLHPHVRQELLRLRAQRAPVRPSDPVFLSRRGTRFSNVRKSWATALRGAGLADREGLTFHSLRHTFATHFLEGGGAVTDLQQQLGHAHLATTQIYAAALSKRRRRAVLSLDFLRTTDRRPRPRRGPRSVRRRAQNREHNRNTTDPHSGQDPRRDHAHRGRRKPRSRADL